jgi:4-azaleucine resistance transporter AzlC
MKKTVLFALKSTVPILCGYLCIGIAFGILMADAGYNWLWTTLCSVVIYAGSMQIILVGLLAAGAPLGTVAVMTLLVNCRHIFYGLAFVDKFRYMGRAYPYMVSSLTDETFSALCSLKCPDDVEEDRAALLISLLDHLYWVVGSAVGAVAGSLIPFNMTGVDFAMTALFVVIFVDQWKTAQTHLPALIGFVSVAVCLLALGPDRFILPSLIAAVALLMVCRPVIYGKQRRGAL